MTQGKRDRHWVGLPWMLHNTLGMPLFDSLIFWGEKWDDIYLTEVTNHTLGLLTALNIISQSSPRATQSSNSALLLYVSRGVVTSRHQVHTLMASLATRLETIKTRVVISTFGLGLLKRKYEKIMLLLKWTLRSSCSSYFFIYILWCHSMPRLCRSPYHDKQYIMLWVSSRMYPFCLCSCEISSLCSNLVL